MKRTIPWLAALICAGGFSSGAFAFHPFASLRRGNSDQYATNQTTAPASQIVTDQVGPITNAPIANGSIGDCGAGCRAGILSGHALGIGTHITASIEGVKQWLSNVPQKTPPPPKPLPINPYTRSPRDFFMVGDP
jgi:hypothetical protein